MDDNGIYTYPVIAKQPASPRSTGSFGPVFVVLAVIIVISAVACVLGRLCSKRLHRAKEAAGKPPKVSKQKPGLGPTEWQKPNFAMRDGDIEFGFDKKLPSSKGAKGGGKGNGNQPKSYHGGKKTEVTFADNV